MFDFGPHKRDIAVLRPDDEILVGDRGVIRDLKWPDSEQKAVAVSPDPTLGIKTTLKVRMMTLKQASRLTSLRGRPSKERLVFWRMMPKQTLTHLLTHRHGNPFCKSCVKAKMRHVSSRSGAFKREVKTFGGQLLVVALV